MQNADTEVAFETGRARLRPKPGWPLRILEGAGLVGVLFGFAAGQALWMALGVAAIVLSYAIYRKRHGRRDDGGGSDAGQGNRVDDGGGGDGDGGD